MNTTNHGSPLPAVDPLAGMDPLRRSALEKCWAYEKHPASTDQTIGVSACSAALALLTPGNFAEGSVRAIHNAADRLMELHNEVAELRIRAMQWQGKWAAAVDISGAHAIRNGEMESDLTAQRERLRALDEQIRTDDLGHVTLTASDAPMRIVNIYLGESPLPVGVGTSLSEAIDVMRELQPLRDLVNQAAQATPTNHRPSLT